MPALDATLQQKIAALEAKQRLRNPQTTARLAGARVLRAGQKYISFSCNDYLGLSHHPAVIAAAQHATERYGAGAGASRLITGGHPLYEALEATLCEYKQTEAACVFGSGYLANLGTITALVGRGDAVIADKLVHACILDAIQLSGAKLLRFAHNDAADCARLLEKHRDEFNNCLVVTETIFSMDGDIAPLAELRALCNAHDAWLMTDDAHGIGFPAAAEADIQMGTLSKAVGAYGGYVCGSAMLIRYLKSAARSLMFTTGLPPATLAAADMALSIIMEEPERGAVAILRARQFARQMGLPAAKSPIVPLIIGEEGEALALAKRLELAGFLVTAIRPPTVPEGTSRLRFAFSSEHEEGDVTNLIKAIENARTGT